MLEKRFRVNLKDVYGSAIILASQAHAGQVDKSGSPYIEHPLRVAITMPTRMLKVAAVLHDVVEDTDVTLGYLTLAGFSPVLVDIIDHISKRDGEAYEDFIKRCCTSKDARIVKTADINDNMSPTRLLKMSPDKRARLILKYTNALNIIQKYE